MEEELLGCAFFSMDIDGCPDLVIKKISGLQKEMEVAASDTPIGSMAKGKAQTQATPGIVKFGSALTIEFLGGTELVQQKLADWYKDCHSTGFSGGKTNARNRRATASLFIHDGTKEEPAVEITFRDFFPENMTQVEEVSVAKAGEAAVYKLECRYTGWQWVT